MTRTTLGTAVEHLRAGRGVLVTDAKDRENEGDVVLPAATVTEEQIAFLMSECRGLVCVSMTGPDLDRLSLPLMVTDNRDQYRTAFTVSVDARHGVTTGISAADRALTARLLADPATVPDDLVRPGHLFPLRAVEGGVLARPGHTEAAVELMRLAGLPPVAVICEVAGRDGRMLRDAALDAFAERHALPLLTITDIARAVGSAAAGG